MFVNNFSHILRPHISKNEKRYSAQLRNTIFYKKTNVLQDFHICISVPLNLKTDVLMLMVYIKNSWNLHYFLGPVLENRRRGISL